MTGPDSCCRWRLFGFALNGFELGRIRIPAAFSELVLLSSPIFPDEEAGSTRDNAEVRESKEEVPTHHK